MRQEEEEEEEETVAEEKLRQLQKMAEKATVGSSTNGSLAASASTPSLSSSVCPKSHWQQVGNLLLYTAAGVRGSDKVRRNLKS